MNGMMSLAQVALAAALGAIVGVERAVSAQAAGVRTHMLVCLGATLFTLAGDVTGADPTRIAAQVVSGIGFLGGGAILRGGLNIRGLTTAASLWVTAAVGLAVGMRVWWAAIATAVLALVVLRYFRWVVDNLLPQRQVLEITLLLGGGTTLCKTLDAAREVLPECRLVKVQHANDAETLVLRAHTHGRKSIAELGDLLLDIPGIAGVEVSG